MIIKKAKKKDAITAAKLAKELWSKHSSAELETEFIAILSSDKASVYIGYEGDAPVAFAEVSVRHEYVEGAAASPVAYLEGIFVKETHRGRGIARKLMAECQEWAKEKNCREFASDCELGNEKSYRFHLKNGFKEANRIICFIKPL